MDLKVGEQSVKWLDRSGLAVPNRSEGWISTIRQRMEAYWLLTQPALQFLVVLTGAAALALEGDFRQDAPRFGLVLLLLAVSVASAKALNQYLERHLDARMTRTRLRRPLPRGLITPQEALAFSAISALIATFGFWIFFNPLSALLALGTVLFYSFFYTLLLKPRTPLSIVIGGIAGGMGPLIAWAATGAPLNFIPWMLLLLIFLWTPPHFWSLAIFFQDDYRISSYPMLPNLIGINRTWNMILGYVWLTVVASLLFAVYLRGWIYALTALTTGIGFLWCVYLARKAASKPAAKMVFSYSILYLLAQCAAIILQTIIS
jgi:protoheme IX farnesyltransferase